MSTLRCWAPVLFLIVYAVALGADVAGDVVRWPWVLGFAVTLGIHIREQARKKRDARRG
jgi:uncharacterized membrane protein (DUF485 family)